MQKRICVSIAMVLALGMLASAAPARAQASDKAAVESLYKQFSESFNKKDVKGIMALYAPDCFVFDIMPPRQYAGWDAYKKDWEDTLAAFPGPVTTTVSDLHITVAGPVAYTHYIVDGTMTDGSGKASHLVVRSTDVLRKSGSKWLIVQEHNSFPVDLTTGQADTLSKP